MPRHAYIEKNLSAERIAMIDHANEIIAEYAAAGYTLTLRQLFYQFVSRDLIPNTQRDYKRLGDIISDGRMTGRIDWNAIADRLRTLNRNAHWESPKDVIDAAAEGYAIDKWRGQKHRVEVWVEKDALSDIVGQVCERLDVPYLVCRGYASQSALFEAGQRLQRFVDNCIWPVVLHLGDHDPSGVDMSRDNEARLHLFGSSDIELVRIALNEDQIEQYDPPPNPAKETDSRSSEYIARHGESSWELDALDPAVLAGIIETNVLKYRDEGIYSAREKREKAEREELRAVADNWPAVKEFLRKKRKGGKP